MLQNELLASLFDGQPHPLSGPVAAWLGSSRRFAAFVTANHPKIRKKLRSTRERESLQDLRLELETAYLLLRERSLSVAYEPQDCGQERCPDFAVTFTSALRFMVEVTRPRASAGGDPVALPPQAERIADVICGKLGQMPAQHANVLVVEMEPLLLDEADLRAAMLRTQQRVERDDPALWQRYRFPDRAAFFRHYQRLSEVLVRGERLQAGEPPLAWVNPQARDPLPARVRTALYRSHTLER